MCGKFHTPLRLGQVKVIISCQKCDFSLKNFCEGVLYIRQDFPVDKRHLFFEIGDGPFCVEKINSQPQIRKAQSYSCTYHSGKPILMEVITAQ